MSIEKEILQQIVPDETQRELVNKTVSRLIERVRNEASKIDLRLSVQLVGSVAKDTYIYPPDIDIFVMFPPEIPREEMERKGLEIGRKVLDGEEHYAEHPYVRGMVNGLKVDLVPCYNIKDTTHLKSAVDRTPFHTEYIKNNLKENQKNEVRLLKQFMKGIGVYGAEARVEGFSGYLTELLVIYYGDFKSVIEAASTEWHYGIELSLVDGRRGKFDSPLIFYDPVDLNRNVASALSVDRFALFIHASREYLREPRMEFFFPPPRQPLLLEEIEAMIERRGTSPLIVKMKKPDVIDDNLFPQIRKTLDGIGALLKKAGFEILDSAYHVNEKVFFIFELQSSALPPTDLHRGPPVWSEHSERFLSKWRSGPFGRPFIRKGRWMVLRRREFCSAKELLINRLEQASLGSEFRRLEDLKLEEGREVFTEENRKALSTLLDKRMGWEF